MSDNSVFSGEAAAAVISAVSIGIGLVLGKVFNALRLKRLDTHKTSFSANEQAIAVYKDIIDDLRVDMRELITKMDRQEEEYAQERADNAALRVEVKALNERVSRLMSELHEVKSEYEAAIAELKSLRPLRV